MVQFVLISRVSDGLPLCASMDTGKNDDIFSEYQKQAKLLVKKLGPENSNPLPIKASISTGSYIFYYTVENGVCFMVLCDYNYPKILTFSFLMEVQKSFLEEFTHSEIQSAVRPYHFLGFETTLQKTKKRYLNTRSLRTPHNLGELSTKLQSVKGFDIKTILGPEYVAPLITPRSQAAASNGSSASSDSSLASPGGRETGLTTRSSGLIAISTFMALVVILRDLLPFFNWFQRANSFNRLRSAEEHIHNELPLILQYLNLVSGLSCCYVIFQALCLVRGHHWVRFPATVYSIFALVHVIAMLLAWVAYEEPKEPVYILVARIFPSVAFVTILGRFLLATRGRVQVPQIHKD